MIRKCCKVRHSLYPFESSQSLIHLNPVTLGIHLNPVTFSIHLNPVRKFTSEYQYLNIIYSCRQVFFSFSLYTLQCSQPLKICRYIHKRYIFSGPDILHIYCLLTLSRTAFGFKKLSAVMLSMQRLVEDWLLDIVLWYELKQQKVKVIDDAEKLVHLKIVALSAV